MAQESATAPKRQLSPPPPKLQWTLNSVRLSPALVLGKSYWQWKKDAPGYEAYKNEILIQYQNAMSACGIPQVDQKIFVQQVIQENGALDPSLTGGTDRGYSFGIGQWNTSPIKAATWLKRHPEQKTLEWQIAALSETSCALYNMYPNNTRRAIVHHNCPECAIHNARPSLCSGVDSLRKIGGRWSCYYDNEVAQASNLLTLSPL